MIVFHPHIRVVKAIDNVRPSLSKQCDKSVSIKFFFSIRHVPGNGFCWYKRATRYKWFLFIHNQEGRKAVAFGSHHS